MGKPLIWSKSGDASAIAPRIGADLYLARPLARRKRLYKGLANLVASSEDAVRQRPEFIFFDQIGSKEHPLGPTADALRRRHPVWGCSTIAELLELDRAFAMSVAVEHGIRIPRTYLFDRSNGDAWDQIDLTDRNHVHEIKGHLKEAKRFVEETKRRYVLKPLGNAANSLTYVSRNWEDMAHRLANAEAIHELKPTDTFMIQEFVPGVEISVEFFFANGEPVYPPNSTIEEKKLLNGDLGPATGCSRSWVWAYQEKNPRIVSQTIGRQEFLAWMKHPVGPDGEKHPPFSGALDGNFIVSEADHKPYLIEFTPRCGYNALYAWLELLDDDLHDTLAGVVKGERHEIAMKYGFGYALRVSTPPYPCLEELDEAKDAATMERMLRMCTDVDILCPEDNEHIWLLDAKKENGQLKTAGFDGVVMEVTGWGETPDAAQDAAQDLFKDEVIVADAQARLDRGRCGKDLERLRAWGCEVPGIEQKPNETGNEPGRVPEAVGTESGHTPGDEP